MSVQEKPKLSKIEVGDVEFEAEENRENLSLASFESEDEFHVLQFVGPVEEEWIETLEKLGITFGDYVPDNAYVVKMGFHTILQVTLIRNAEFVRFITKYVSEFKISSRLKGRKGVLPLVEFKALPLVPESVPYDEQGNITVVLHDSAYMSEASHKIDELGGTIVGTGEDSIRVAIDPLSGSIEKIAEIKGVMWIEPYVPPELCLDEAANLVNAPPMWNNHNLDGTGQIIAIADTGIDTGVNDHTMHADFRGRIVRIYHLGRKAKNDASDAPLKKPAPCPYTHRGHGTHVAGIALGNGASSGGQIRGIAPGASLVFESVMDRKGRLGGLPVDLHKLFLPPYKDKKNPARIHNNSWGARHKKGSLYNDDSRNVDKFVWDYRDMVIVFAAGNDGNDANSDGIVDLGFISAPGTAKNCITVGGSENDKKNIMRPGNTWGKFHNSCRNPPPPRTMNTDPIRSDLWADKPEGMMAVSSRGPVDDRIKPDLVAPGSSILSTKSSLTTDNHVWGVSPNPAYMYMGGTSMATPMVSGAAAIVRQYLGRLKSKEEDGKKWRKRVRDPKINIATAALIKAILIHGAKRIRGQYGLPGDPKNDAEDHSPKSQGRIPNNSQGFGRLDLEQSLFPPAPTTMEIFDGHRVSTKEQTEYQFLLQSDTVPFTATLVWTDSPGKRLQNDLTLIVHTPDGKEFHGNFVDAQQPGKNIDDKNNVEKIIIEVPILGIYRIDVKGDNVPKKAPGGKGQDYALVVSAGLSATLKADIKPSDEYPARPDNPGKLPAAKLCNKNPPLNPIKGDDPLVRGDSRKKLVEHLQTMLFDLGFDLGRTGEYKDGVDGVFGELTEKAVKDFQGKNKDWNGNWLKVDKRVGPKTSDALNRAMVGIWYDEYVTPKELTKDTRIITATEHAIKEGLSFDPDPVKSIKVFLKKRRGTKAITLLDPSGKRFSFKGEGRFEVLDKDEKLLSSGKLKSEDDIIIQKTVTKPFSVELKVDKTFYTFYGE